MKRLIAIAVTAFIFAGCQFRKDVIEFHGSLSDIKTSLDQMNTSLHSLQILAEVVEGSFYLKSVETLKEKNEEVGYKVTFSNGQEFTILHGEKGNDAVRPELSIVEDTDGFWYWTLDGEYLKTPDGKRVPVTAEDGKYTVVPKLDIRDDLFVISYDNGATWSSLGKFTGDKGADALNGDYIESIDCTTSPDYVLFTLLDGSTITVYTVSALETLQKIRSRLNSNIVALWHMADAMDTGGYVRGVTGNVDNGDRTGYVLEFHDETKITAYDVVPETTLWYPTLYVERNEDGEWIWKIEGRDRLEWKQDSETLPKLMIESNKWFLSSDNGETWVEIGRADDTMEKKVMITGIDHDSSGKVSLGQGNGVVLSVEKIPGLYIRMSEKENIPICPGIPKEIPYEILEGEGNIEVGVITADFWEAKVVRHTERRGVIVVMAPDPYCEENVKVMVSCNGEVIMETLTFREDVVPMGSLDIMQEEVTLYAGFAQELEVIILPEATSDKTLTWTTSDPTIAVVSPVGRVVAVSEGECFITVSAQGYSDVCKVVVKKYDIPVESISVLQSEMTLEENATGHIDVDVQPYNATDKNMKWSSSAPDIVEVNQSGTIMAKQLGEAVITVSLNGFTAECRVTVIEAVEYEKFREFIVNGVSFKMIKVKSGTFVMGSNDYDNSRPMRDVTISRDYYIAETETTLALWNAVVGRFLDGMDTNQGDDLNRPVVSVFHDHVQVFLQALNEATGENFRLPTEAEWEYAAKGGIKSMGYRYSGSDDVSEVGWYYHNSSEGYTHPGTGFPLNSLHPVKTKKPNELGIYDMTGNADEWCSDYYQVYPVEPETDPTGPLTEPKEDPWGGYYHSSYRVHRGGNYNSDEWGAGVCNRGYLEPGYPYSVYGFRIVLPDVDASEN